MTNDKLSLTGFLDDSCTLINIHYSPILKRFLNSFVGHELEIDLQKLRKNRSASQNRYYWGVMIKCICAHHEQTQGSKLLPNQAHYYNLTKVLDLDFKSQIIFGKVTLVFEDAKSSSEMSTTEFNDFIKKIQSHFSLNYGLNIPDPNQQNFLNQYNSF